MNENIEFQNTDFWRGSSSGKFGLSFKQIVLQHINRCVINSSVEWHGGYWQERNASNFTIEKVYTPNTREVFCNSIKILRALLFCYFDSKMETEDKKFKEDFNEKYKSYSNVEDKGSKEKQEWYDYKVDWHIRLFEQLIMLSKRLNFFEEESGEETQE